MQPPTILVIRNGRSKSRKGRIELWRCLKEMIPNMTKEKLFKEILIYLLFAAAILLTAWKGTLDWMGLAIIAVILKLPGTQWIRAMFKDKVPK